MSEALTIAIDGPVASGKTTVGKLVAQKLGYRFVDTGQMYRALTWLALQEGVSLDDEAGLTGLAVKTEIVLSSTGRVLVQGHDVTDHIHSPEVETAVSRVSVVPGVRKRLVEQQQRMAAAGDIIMVGRDITTTVLPDSGLKIFLTASVEERARRRYEERGEKGEAEHVAILANLRQRDYIDSHRETSPLKPALDAHIMDTDKLTAEQVADRIVALAQEKKQRHDGHKPC